MYSERIKNFGRIRAYMKEFYVYGFKSREEYTSKSARSYDDERRRVESWLGDYMRFQRTPDGKNVFLSIDSRLSRHNPLYAAWKTRSFTDGDVTLHFLLMDILHDPDTALSVNEIVQAVDEKLREFKVPRTFDLSTVRKKLQEYVREGLLFAEKHGKSVYYRRGEPISGISEDLLDFYSEVFPCGVIGSFLLDRSETHRDLFAFKHHYITGALDSEVLCSLLEAMGEKRMVRLTLNQPRRQDTREKEAVPLRIMISVQNGRQYVMAYVPEMQRITSFRLDYIVSVQAGDVCAGFDSHRATLEDMEKHMWGVSTQSRSGARMEHVEFTIRHAADETHIPQRLEREKRCGAVERLDAEHSRFSADVYDASEMIPWIRTFLCRITEIHFSDPDMEERFRSDVREMYAQYGVEGGEQG